MSRPTFDDTDSWPSLPLEAWRPTYETLHRWTQIVGKIELSLAPPRNHWWQCALRVTPRGLTTGLIPYREGSFELALDLVVHDLVVTTSDGHRKTLPLVPMAVADFYAKVMALLHKLGIDVHIWTTPVEIPGDETPFEEDRVHSEYVAPWATRFLRALQQADLALEQFASRFQGKQSPVHFFWGSFDLASTRFSGRRAPVRPEADRVTREAYSHEVASFGFWPGSEGIVDAAFYAYGAPEPEGLSSVELAGPGRYDPRLKEFVLPYEDIRRARAPREEVLAFFQAAYDAIATLGRWERAALDRAPDAAPGGGPPPVEAHGPEQPSA